MINNSSKWSMEFTNDEIKCYLADKTKEWAEVCYLVDDIYVEEDCKDNFDYITFDGITPAVKYRRFYLLKFPSAALVYAPLRSVLNRCPLDI